jgi:hypothetical protein
MKLFLNLVLTLTITLAAAAADHISDPEFRREMEQTIINGEGPLPKKIPSGDDRVGCEVTGVKVTSGGKIVFFNRLTLPVVKKLTTREKEDFRLTSATSLAFLLAVRLKTDELDLLEEVGVTGYRYAYQLEGNPEIPVDVSLAEIRKAQAMLQQALEN